VRLVAWNCQDAFSRKLDALAALRPDVAIVSEVRRSVLQRLPEGTSSIWEGPEDNKGLAVVGFGDWRIRSTGGLHGNWFAPFEANAPGRLLRGVGAWTETSATKYQITAQAAVEKMLTGVTPMVVAGDFNLSEAADPEKLKGCRVSEIAAALNARGLTSAWHARTAETFGEEATKTYFHGRRPGDGFHIDYAFLDRQRLDAVERMSIGVFADWVASGLSDHCPLVIEINDEALRD
jgi:exodeoxyribonuclease III